MIKSHTAEGLDTWLNNCAASTLSDLVSFAAGIKADYGAVKAALVTGVGDDLAHDRRHICMRLRNSWVQVMGIRHPAGESKLTRLHTFDGPAIDLQIIAWNFDLGARLFQAVPPTDGSHPLRGEGFPPTVVQPLGTVTVGCLLSANPHK